jgi:hypothetical protein
MIDRRFKLHREMMVVAQINRMIDMMLLMMIIVMMMKHCDK